MIAKPILLLLFLLGWSFMTQAQSCSDNDKLYSLALKSYEALDYEKATKLVQKSIERCEYFDNLILLGDIQHSLTNYSVALTAYENAERVAPTDDDRAKVFAKYGSTLSKKGLVHDALSHYRLAGAQHSKPLPVWISSPLKELEIAVADKPLTSEQIKRGIGTMKMGLSLPKDRLSVKPSINIRDIYFEFDSVELTSTSDGQLNALIAALGDSKNKEGFLIKFVGHSDKRGGAEYNKKLSYDRANHVKEIVISKHPELTSKIMVEGRGWNEPFIEGSTEKEHALNRRLTLEIQ